jgi:hypothetical protein
LATQSELGLAIAVAQKAVVPGALETVQQNMQQETANEFVASRVTAFCRP